MMLKNSYYYFKEALPPDVCKRIIALGLKTIEEKQQKGIDTTAYTDGNCDKSSMPEAVARGELTKEQVVTAQKEGKLLTDTYVRDSKVAWLTDPWLYDLILPYVTQANMLAGWNWDWDHTEAFQFTVYEPDGFYGWHKDGGSDSFAAYKRYIYGVTPEPLKDNKLPSGYVLDNQLVGKIRKISLTINLNATGDYEGGNLKFDFGHHTDNRFHECEEIRPQGSMIVFPSFLDHCVTPVTSGTRYSLVLWVVGEPWK